MEALETPDDGYDYPEPDVDTFNEDAVSEMSDAPPRRVIERLESTHRRLRDALANTPSQPFQPRPSKTTANRRVVIPTLRGTRRADCCLAGNAFKQHPGLDRRPLTQAGHLARRVEV